VRFNTSQIMVRCRCINNHVFTTGIYVGINVDSQPDVYESFSKDGTQVVICPECKELQPLAEPVELINPSRERFAVFIPEMLAHRELEIRAKVSGRLADANPEELPTYVGNFETIIGKRALKEWISIGSSGDDGINDGQASEKIRAAFADLTEHESLMPFDDRPSEFDLQSNDDAKLSEDDLAASRQKKESDSPPPIDKSNSDRHLALRTKKGAAPLRKSRPGIDFAGLLSGEEYDKSDSVPPGEDRDSNTDSVDDFALGLALKKNSDTPKKKS